MIQTRSYRRSFSHQSLRHIYTSTRAHMHPKLKQAYANRQKCARPVKAAERDTGETKRSQETRESRGKIQNRRSLTTRQPDSGMSRGGGESVRDRTWAAGGTGALESQKSRSEAYNRKGRVGKMSPIRFDSNRTPNKRSDNLRTQSKHIFHHHVCYGHFNIYVPFSYQIEIFFI